MKQHQISVRHLAKTPSMEFHVQKRVEKLIQLHSDINKCHIDIHLENKHGHSSKSFCVRVSLDAPGLNLLIVKKIDKNLYTAIHTAFDKIQRMMVNACEDRRRQHCHALSPAVALNLAS